MPVSPPKKKKAGPCPDPLHYILVNGKYGSYWRLKRGTLKPVMLNATWEASRKNTQISSPAAHRILNKLAPFTERMDPYGRAGAISGMLRRSLNEKGRIDFSYFKDYDIQVLHPLTNLLVNDFTVLRRKDMVTISITLDHIPVEKHNSLVTAYSFEAILLYGDPTKENALRVETDQSPLYSFKQPVKGKCVLTLQAPANKIWMVWLKAGCREGKQPAMHAKHYGMRVVAVG